MSKTKYVLGFLFSNNKKEVVLIKKNRPLWQKGLYNGVGGHVEDGETPLKAMKREFNEETGVKITKWTKFAVLRGMDFEVFCYKSFSDKSKDVETRTDEQVSLKYTDRVKLLPVISNIPWLIEICLDPDSFVTTIKYK